MADLPEYAALVKKLHIRTDNRKVRLLSEGIKLLLKPVRRTAVISVHTRDKAAARMTKAAVQCVIETPV